MSTSHRILVGIVVLVFDLAIAFSVTGQTLSHGLPPYTSPPPATDSGAPTTRVRPLIEPVRATAEQQGGIDWSHLVRQSLLFMSLENAFRCATEERTRDGFSNPFFRGYFNSVGNLHGWSDGDPFYVNYVGHPMQGAVSEYLWTQNDRGYRDIQFGHNRRYWKGKLRGTAYSYIYSVLFEIGPMSEASTGNIQATYPQQGFVDHVVTPVIGLGWSIAEDALDQYFIKYLEMRTSNSWARLLVRGGLNPARSMANALKSRLTWGTITSNPAWVEEALEHCAWPRNGSLSLTSVAASYLVSRPISVVILSATWLEHVGPLIPRGAGHLMPNF